MTNSVTQVHGPGLSGLWHGLWGNAVLHDASAYVAVTGDGVRHEL